MLKYFNLLQSKDRYTKLIHSVVRTIGDNKFDLTSFSKVLHLSSDEEKRVRMWMDLCDPKQSEINLNSSDKFSRIKKIDNFAYLVLNDFAVTIKSPSMNFKPGNWISYSDLVLPLFQKTMGVILKEKLEATGHIHKQMVIVKRHKGEEITQNWITPIFPTCE